jgi:hypothetical protein
MNHKPPLPLKARMRKSTGLSSVGGVLRFAAVISVLASVPVSATV